MAGYIGTKAAVVTPGAERKKVFSITTTTSSLTGLAYIPGFVHVFHNGVRLVDGTDYTATNGTSLTLTTAAQNGDEVVVISYATFEVADAYTKAESDDRYVNVTGDTMTGSFGVGSGVSNRLALEYNAISGLATFGPNSAGGSTSLSVGTSDAGSFVSRMNITSTGSVGIGTSSPVANTPLTLQAGSGYTDTLWLKSVGTNIDSRINIAPTGTGLAQVNNTNGTPIAFQISGIERARIDASGNMRLSTNTSYLEVAPNATWGKGFRFGGNGNVSDATYANICTTNGNLHIDPTVGGFGTYFNWYTGTEGVHVGNATGGGYGQIRASAFTTISDYRLKENVVPLAGAADRLAQISVHRFNFIADPDTIVDGFLAHEVQAFVPEAVTGEKDAVDKDGNPVHQGIDQSKLVPLLTAALQEALARIETLEADVAALKGEPA